MKKKLSLLLAVVMAVTMVLGMSMTAWAVEPANVYAGTTWSTHHIVYGGQSYNVGSRIMTAGMYPVGDATYKIVFTSNNMACVYHEGTGNDMEYSVIANGVHVDEQDIVMDGGYLTGTCNIMTSLPVTFYLEKTGDAPKPDPDPTPQPEQPKAPEEEPTPQFSEENYVPDVVQNDKAQFGKESEGSVPSGAYNFSAYVSPSGFAKGVEKIADKKDAKGNITVYSGKPLTINKELLNTLTAKNMSMTYFFNYGGHLYSVTIPAGVNPALVLDANGHGGPLYVGWLLGTSRLIK